MGLEHLPGRSHVDAVLGEALTAAVRGSGELVVLTGEAGIGKTATARQLATAARRIGVAVRWSGCSAGGGAGLYAPWPALLAGFADAGCRAIASLAGSPIGDPATAAAGRASAYAAVTAALQDATTDRPALLVLDDLQWADAGAVQLLDAVAAQLPGLPVLMIGTYRDTDLPAGSPLVGLGGRADPVPLRGLGVEDVGVLLGRHVGAARGSSHAREVLAMTAGNPFLVVQIGRLLAEDPQALDRMVLPAAAGGLLRQRLAPLSRPDRAVLVAAGVLGSPFRVGDLGRLLDRAPSDITAALERAAGRRIVERAHGTAAWAFVHELFRHAAVEGGEPGQVANLHRSAAGLLQEAGGEPAVVAAHLLDAGLGGTEVAQWLTRAGDRALVGLAWEEAAALFRRALDLLDPGDDPDLRADALAGLGRALLLAGDQPSAARAFQELADLGRTSGSAELLARAALGFSADLAGFEVRLFDQRQIDLLEEAAGALHQATDPGLRATVLARLSVALSLSAPDTRRLDLAEAAVALARQAGDPRVLARALAAHCDAIAGPDHVDRRRQKASEIITIAQAERDGPLELLGRRLRYVACLERGDLAAVEEDVSAFARRAELLGNPLYAWYVPLWRAQFAVASGSFEEADALVDEVAATGRNGGSINAPIMAIVLRVALCWQRGAYAEALGLIDSAGPAVPELAPTASSIGTYALANALAGRTAQGAAYLDRAAALTLQSAPADAEWLPNMVNVVRAAVNLNHPILAEALRLLEPYAALVAFEGIGAGLYGSVARTLAVACSALNRHEDAIRYAEQALAMDRRFGGVLLADARRVLADCTARHADRAVPSQPVAASVQADGSPIGTIPMPRSIPLVPGPSDRAPNELRREGDFWRIVFDGTTVIVKHSKGLADLATLLASPGRELHVSELEHIPPGILHGDGGEALDRRAIAAYRARLVDLAAEVEEAHAANDPGRAAAARSEYDALVHQLSSAVGLGGRSRAAGAEPAERLRKAVSARIRDAIRHAGAAHRPLGRHLANSVRTGLYCSYQPELPTSWRTSRRPTE